MKKICVLFSVFILLLFSSRTVEAGSGTVSVSSANVTQGQEFSVTIKIDGHGEEIANVKFNLRYDTTMLEYKSKAGVINFLRLPEAAKDEVTVTFTALKSGTTSLQIEDIVMLSLYGEEAKMNASPSNGTVTIKAPYTASKENTLSSLTVGQGSLNPAFSKDITSYTMNVDNSVKSITISAPPTDSKAKVSISGNGSLKVGSNTVSIKVTAESGDEKIYTITVNRAQGETAPQVTNKPEVTVKPTAVPTVTPKPTIEPTQEPTPEVTVEPTSTPEPIKVEIDGDSLNIVSDYTEIEIPEGFEVTTYEYEGKEIEVLKGTTNGLVLFYLSDDNFYVFDEEKRTLQLYQTVSIVEYNYTILELEDETLLPEGYIKVVKDVMGKNITVWVATEDSEFYLFYGMNNSGEKKLYQFDSVEKTIQRFNPASTLIVEAEAGVVDSDIDKTVSKLEKSKKVLIVTIVAVLSLLVILGAVIISLVVIRKRQDNSKIDLDSI